MTTPDAARLVRLPQVLECTGLSKSALYTLIGDGDFPRPVSLVPSGRAVAWPIEEVLAWIDCRKAARGAGGRSDV